MNIKKLFAVLAGVSMLATQLIPAGALAATYSQELQDAYSWAYSKSITTMSSIDNANMYGAITRAELAKMLANWAKDKGQTPDTSKACSFTDTASVQGDLATAIVEACQLGLMGQGITAFRPYDTISRAEFGTALSRALWGSQYEGGNPYYVNHLNALKAAGIMTQIANAESTKEVRGYVMLMLMRSEGAEGSSATSDCDDPLVVIACAAESDACPAACREGSEEEVNDEIVKSGDLVVNAVANNGGAIINKVPSDLDTLTFKTSEEVTISKVVLERYGYSAYTDIASVWLENEDGLVISNKKAPNSKGLVTLTIDKDYRAVDGTLNATIVVETINLAGKVGKTIGFKAVEVESTAESVELPTKNPTTYSVIEYDGSVVIVTPKAGNKDYNFAEGESYEVAKFKVKAADSAAILVNGFTLEDIEVTNPVKLKDVIENVVVTVDDVEVKGLKYSVDKKKLTVSFNEIEIAAKQSANFVLSISLTDFDNYFNDVIQFQLSSSDFNAVESKTSARVSLDDALTSGGPWALWKCTFAGGKVKYTSSKLSKVDAAAGDTNVVVAEGTLEIPETVNLTFKIPADANVEAMRMYVAGEEFEGELKAGNFVFDAELTKGGKVQFKIDIKENANKGEKIAINSISLKNDANLTLSYDSNGASAKAQASGSFDFTEVTIAKAKASLENNLDDDSVEFVKGDKTARKVVFDGTYTAKKADVYLNEVVFDGVDVSANPTTFYLYLDGQEVSDVTFDTAATSDNDEFSKVLVKAGESVSVKVEAKVEANTKGGAYAFTLTLNGADIDDIAVSGSPVPMAEFSVVDKGSITVSSAASKATVLLRKANTTIASFTLKPEKGEVDLENLAFTAVNGTVNLTADDISVKVDGTNEDGETVYDAEKPYAAGAITKGDLVSYNGNLYQAKATITATDWATDSTNFKAVPTYTATVTYAKDDYVYYNGKLYKASAAVDPATDWATDKASFADLPNHIVYDDINETLKSEVTVEVVLKTKTTGTVTLTLTDVNEKQPNKEFTKRFEDALVWVDSQKDNEGSTTFVLGVSKAESSDEISNVCLYYTDASHKKCVTSSVSDGNDDLEWTNPASAQIMIDAISYEVNGDGTCIWDGSATDTDGDSYAGPGSCVVITKNSYNDYFKVGDTYAKIFKVD